MKAFISAVLAATVNCQESEGKLTEINPKGLSDKWYSDNECSFDMNETNIAIVCQGGTQGVYLLHRDVASNKDVGKLENLYSGLNQGLSG